MGERESRLKAPEPALATLVGAIESLEAIVRGWDESHRLTVTALTRAIEDLHREALSRLIRQVKTEPVAAPVLRRAVGDDVVYAVLRHLGLIKPSLDERIEQALRSVRPFLESHGGDVELIRVQPPDAVEVKLMGACDGCPASGLTLSEGIEKAIREHCPEITTVIKVKGRPRPEEEGDGMVMFVSPFAKHEDDGWQYAVDLAQVPENDITVILLAGHSLLMSRRDGHVTCFENACAHMGMPLDTGAVADGVLTCPYHGFRYDLSSGECLTVPEVQLAPHAVRVIGSRVEVNLRS